MAYTDLNKKLDWAMSFQRTGKFPLDRSSMFGSYADALAYAKQDGSDSRQIGGTSYVGQIVCVFGPGADGHTEEIAAYIITAVGAGASLRKFAQSSASGDVEDEIAQLGARITAAEGDITKLKGTVGDAESGLVKDVNDAKTKLATIENGAQVNVLEGVQVGGVDLEIIGKKVNVDLSNYATKQDLQSLPKFAIAVVAELPEDDISTTTVYLKAHEHGDSDVYDEYIYVNNKWEKIGNTDIDLSNYATKAYADQAETDAVSAAKTYTDGQLANYTTTEGLTTLLSDKADASALTELDGRVDGIDGRLTTAEEGVSTNKSEIAAIKTDVSTNYAKKTDKIATAGTADLAKALEHTLTAGEKTFDGTADVKITAADLGAITAIPQATSEALGGIKIGHTEGANEHAVVLDGDGKAYVTVEVPEAVSYTAGSGLTLSGTEFSIGSGQVADGMIAAVNVQKLTQTEGEKLILDGGAAEE